MMDSDPGSWIDGWRSSDFACVTRNRDSLKVYFGGGKQTLEKAKIIDDAPICLWTGLSLYVCSGFFDFCAKKWSVGKMTVSGFFELRNC